MLPQKRRRLERLLPQQCRINERPPPQICRNGQRYFNATANDESGQQKLSAEYASCLPLPLYGWAALVKVVPPPPAASTLTMLAPPGTAALRKHEANL
jgi:hypothetical protein